MNNSKEQLLLRNRAKEELERLENIYKDQNTKRLVDEFKYQFLLCESSYKVILAEHQLSKGKTEEIFKITMNQVPFALTFAGYDFDKELLTKLFGSENHVGIRSVKKIRDALTHKLDANTVNELESRKEELFGYMNCFLDKIRNFDQN